MSALATTNIAPPPAPPSTRPTRPPEQITLSERMPPFDEAAEVALLASMIIGLDVTELVLQIVPTVDYFFFDKHQIIFRVLVELHQKNIPIGDGVIVASTLKTKNLLEEAGGLAFLDQVLNSLPSAAHHEHYARIVREKAMMRGILQLCHSAQVEVYRGMMEAKDIIDTMQMQLETLMRDGSVAMGGPAAERVDIIIEELKNPNAAKDAGGFRTGLDAIDAMMRLRDGDLIGLGALMKHGKSAAAFGFVAHQAFFEGVPGVIFSWEETRDQIIKRLLIGFGGLKREQYQWQDITASQRDYNEQIAAILRERIIIDDTCPNNTGALRQRLRFYQRHHGVRVAVADYYQLLQPVRRENNRVEGLKMVAMELKQIARDLHIPLIVPAQVRNEVADENRPPNQFDIAGCRSFGADCNVLLLLDREFERRKRDNAWLAENPNSFNKATLEIAVTRGGAAGTANLVWDGPAQRFYDEATAPAAQGSLL